MADLTNIEVSERTLFVKPIHRNTPDEEISDFFGAYGTVEAIERINRKGVNGALLTFKEKDAATHCLKAKVSYGTLEGIGKYFIPKLFICTMEEYHAREAVEKDLQKYKRMRGEDTPEESKEESAIGAQCLLRVSDLAPKMTWRDVKATLGEYLKGVAQIAFVIHESSESDAFVVMKTPEGAKAMLAIFNDEANARLQKSIPKLVLVEGEEENAVRTKFSAQSYRKKGKVASA